MFLSQELDLSREQEEAIGAEIDGFAGSFESLRQALARTRGDIADIMRSDTMSENDLAAMFERHDDALRSLHHDAGGRIGRIHDLLDPSQRQTLADLLERGLGRGLAGPYRGEL